MDKITEVIQIIKDTLSLGDEAAQFDENTGLLGSIPEFDSVAVVSLVTALEEEFGCIFDDDELNAEIFATIGSLMEALLQKIDS